MNTEVYKKMVVNNEVQERNDLDFKNKKQLTDAVLQTYFREANRTVDIKLYKATFRHVKDTGGQEKQYENRVMYFCNRIEIGQLQTAKRLVEFHEIFENP